MMTILTPIAANPRTKHTERHDILSAMLILAPAMASGQNLCPFASHGCADACLYYSGRGALGMTQQARINRTRFFLDDRGPFLEQLMREVAAYERRAAAHGKRCAIRLNGTSDIMWEKIPVWRDGCEHPNAMTAFPDVQFYDYTKIPGRQGLGNYHLTFSLSECNDAHAINELERGRNVAVVMRYLTLPEYWSGFPVIDGDQYDYRFLDQPGGNIVALKANGRAVRDTSGFVRSASDVLDPGRQFVPFTAHHRGVPSILQPALPLEGAAD